jgi:flavin reductase (DIM6/NTAB) family NADH-FMN oxidoreductase RutF
MQAAGYERHEAALIPDDPIAKALQSFPYGLFVVGSLHGDRAASIVANWATQLSFKPPLVGIAIESDSRMRDYIEESNVFSLNLLPAGSKETAKAFIKPADSRGSTLNGRSFAISSNGTPFLTDARASLACRVTDNVAVGDHTLFIGRVEEAVIHDEGEVLTLKETGWQYKRKG